MSSSGQVPPHALGAERALLGAMLLDAGARDTAAALVDADDFYQPGHGHVFHTAQRLHFAGEPVDAVTVAAELERAGLLDEVGGSEVLLGFEKDTPAISNASKYAAIIGDHARARRVQAIGAELLNDPTIGLERAVSELEQLQHTGGRGGLTLIAASAIEPDRARWVWDRRLPVGGTALMPGPEGAGKTMFVVSISARLTRGQLEGEWFDRPGDVVYIGVEDDRETVLVPRLIAAGADLDRIHFVDLPDGRPFALSGDVAALSLSIRHLDVALIVIDPLDSHLGGSVDSWKKDQVQSAIGQLARLAQEHRCGALGLAHLNKASVTDYLTKVIGSKGFTTAVRSVLAVGDHPAKEGELVCLVAKANMTSRATVPAVRFKIEATTIDHPTGGHIDTARVVTLGHETGLNADALIAPRQDDEEQSALDEASDFLETALKVGPRRKSELAEEAEVRNISSASLKRAAAALEIVVHRDENAQGRPSTWSLPGYGSGVTAQEAMSRNPDGSDQGEHTQSSGYGSTPELEPKPGDGGPGTVEGWRPCSECNDGRATDICGFCDDCLTDARKLAAHPDVVDEVIAAGTDDDPPSKAKVLRQIDKKTNI